MRIKSLFIALLSAMILSSGCIDLGRKTEWRQNLELHPWFDGPGSVDARLYEYKEEKYEVVSGQGVSVGIFPGFIRLWPEIRQKFVNSRGWDVKCEQCLIIVGYPVASAYINCLLAVPTLGTIIMCCDNDKFADREAKFGLFGCYRWKRTPRETLIKQGDKELVLKCTDDSYHFEILTPPSKFADGSILHFDYPGYKTILSQLENHDKVYVMISEENNAYDYRCFKKSKYVEGALIYEDVLFGKDENADRQVRFQREARKLKGSIESLRDEDGYKNQSFFWDELNGLRKSIDDEIRIGDATRFEDLVEIETRRADLANRILRVSQIEPLAAKVRALLNPEIKHEIFVMSLARRPDFTAKSNDLIKRINEYKNDVARGGQENKDDTFIKEVDDLNAELLAIMDETREMERRKELCGQESKILLERLDELPRRTFYEFVIDDAFRQRYVALCKRVADFSENPSSEKYSLVEEIKSEVNGLEDAFGQLLKAAQAKIDAAKEEIESKEKTIARIGTEISRLKMEVDESCSKIKEEFEIEESECREAISNLEEKIGAQAAREQTLLNDLESARKHTKAAVPSRVALDENSLFAKVEVKAAGVEKVFDYVWRSFYDEGVRLKMYKAKMDCRLDGTPNVVVGDGDSSIVVSVRVERNSAVHDEWKENVAAIFDTLKLSKNSNPSKAVSVPRFNIAGFHYDLEADEYDALKRWQGYQNSMYKADLFLELRCLSGDGCVLLSNRVAFNPVSEYDLSSWDAEEVRVAFEDVPKGVFDLVEKVDAVILDGAAVCKLIESDLADIRKLLSLYRTEKEAAIAKCEARRDENERRIKLERAKGDVKIQEVQKRLDSAVKDLHEAQLRYNCMEAKVGGVQNDDETEDPQDESQEYFSGDDADDVWIGWKKRYGGNHNEMED